MTPERPGCPTCEKAVPADGGFRPFCSSRCKMVDLGRWFQGKYFVPGESAFALDPEEFEEHVRRLEDNERAKQAEDGGDPEPDA